MSEESSLKSCSTLSKEQIRVDHATCETQKLLYHSFMHGEHDPFKEHLETNPVHLNLDGSLKQGIELVMSRKRTLSDVAPTLIILLQNGAKWAHDHLTMPGGMTPYHVICRSTGDHQELLELMIKELGVTPVNVKDDDECTALMYALWNANIKCVKCLIANGADVNLMNDKRNVADMNTGVALIETIRLLHPDYPQSYKTMIGIFDLLLASGADVNNTSFQQNRTPIMYAAMVGNVNCIEKLIQKEAQVNYTDRTGQTAWTLAARAGSVDVLKCLIEDHGIDKNAVDEKGLSVLYWAVSSGNIEAVRYLLKQGVTMTSFQPQECFEACAECGTNLLCHYIDAPQRKTDPYMFAIRSNMSDVVRLMDEYGCELGKSPEILSYAIRVDSVDVVDYLLCNYEYPLNYGYKNKYDDSELNTDQQTFLMEAYSYYTYDATVCEKQSVEVIQLLVEHGAGIYKMCCTEKCVSIINAAIDDRHVDVIACFIRGGVTMNTRSYYRNETSTSGLADIGVVLPFEAAVWDDYIYVVEMFLVSGCSRGIHNWNNNHALKANIGRKMKELLKEWNVHKNNVLPLKQRCRMVILSHFCLRVGKKITELPLPPQLIKYLSIPELDDIVEKQLSTSH